jgi:hypothetical protein
MTHGSGSSELMPLRRARLEWVADESCLVVVVGREQRAAGIASDKVIPVWPTGVTPVLTSGGRRGVRLPGGSGQLLAGDVFSAGGSWIVKDHPQYPLMGTPPGKCTRHDGYFTIDAGSFVTSQ